MTLLLPSGLHSGLVQLSLATVGWFCCADPADTLGESSSFPFESISSTWVPCGLAVPPPKKIAPKQGERREKKSSFPYEVDGIFSNLRRNSLALIVVIQKLGTKHAVHLTHRLL